VARVGESVTAFSERAMPFVLNAVTGWHEPGQAASHQQWARDVVEAAKDSSTGRAYVNFLGDTGTARSSYGPETYDRLATLKRKYDPTNVLRLNQNIDPDAAGA